MIPPRCSTRKQALEDHCIFVELRRLARLDPAAWTAHVGNAHLARAAVDSADVFVDEFGLLPAAVMRVGFSMCLGICERLLMGQFVKLQQHSHPCRSLLAIIHPKPAYSAAPRAAPFVPSRWFSKSKSRRRQAVEIPADA